MFNRKRPNERPIFVFCLGIFFINFFVDLGLGASILHQKLNLECEKTEIDSHESGLLRIRTVVLALFHTYVRHELQLDAGLRL